MQVIEIKEIPKNSDIEVQILAMILKNDKLIRDVVDNVNSTMFYEPFHQEIFKAMLYLHYNNIGIGYETIIDRFKSLGLENVDEVTGYLIELGGANITTGSFESKADLLVDYYRKRELYNHYKNRLQKDMTGIASANLVKEIEALVDGMGINSNIEVTDFENYVDTWMNDQEDETPVNGFKTGFNQLDEDVLLLDTNLMIIGARPSTGKSAFATNLVKNFCLQGKTPLFYHLKWVKKSL